MRHLRGLSAVLCLLLCGVARASTGALAIAASASGEALSEWSVVVAGYDYQGNTVYPSTTLVLNEDGTRTLEPVPVGNYYVGLVGQDGYSLDSGSTAYVQVTDGGTATADLVAWPYVGIHGMVRDNHGVALDGWQVTLTDYNGQSVGPQTSHDGGHFAFASLPDGTWSGQLAPRTGYDAWGGGSVSIYANSGEDGELNLTVNCWANLLGTIGCGTAAGRAGWTVTLLDYNWQPLGTAGPTGTDGQFRFDSLPDGGYHLQLSAHDGWDAPSATDAWCYAGSDTEVTVPVEPWGRLSGVVRLADGTKLSGWTVTCRGWGQLDRVATSAAVTGAFEFGALPDGYYTVDLTPQGAYDAPSTASCYLYGGHNESLTLTPVPWGHVEGSLHTEGGAPLEGWTVTLTGNGVTQTKSSQPDGGFVFEPVADGYYEVNATPQGAYNAPWPAWASVTGGHTSAVSLTAVKWGDLRVNVVDDHGTAQSGWQVTVLDQTGAVRDVQTTAGGPLTFADLPDGWYTVVPTNRNGWNTWSGYATVNAGQTSEATVTVIPWGGVDGVLVDQLERPVGGWTVDLVQNGNIVATAPTDEATGVFTFTTQPDGGYSLQVEQPEGCYDECWGGWVQINAGSQTPTALHVTFMGTVAGTITDADSDPAGAPLQYVSVRLDEWTTTWTDEHGHYEFPPVPIGEHVVACSPGPRYGVAWGRWDERTVTVAHAETYDASWGLHRLDVSGRLSVDVLKPTGTVGGTQDVQVKIRCVPDGGWDLAQLDVWTWDNVSHKSARIAGPNTWANHHDDPPVTEEDGLTQVVVRHLDWVTNLDGRGDSTTCTWPNGDVEVRAGASFHNPFGAPIVLGTAPTGEADAGTAAGATVTPTLENLVVRILGTSNGTQDYLKYDPDGDASLSRPKISFALDDAEGGPMFVVIVLVPTAIQGANPLWGPGGAPPPAGVCYMCFDVDGPGEYRDIEWDGSLTPGGQPDAAAWGAYGFDVYAFKPSGDWTSARLPYTAQLGAHEVWWDSESAYPGHELRYSLGTTSSVANLQATPLDGQLMEHGAYAAQPTVGAGLLTVDAQAERGRWRVVFTGQAQSGADCRRDRRPPRMLAANGEVITKVAALIYHAEAGNPQSHNADAYDADWDLIKSAFEAAGLKVWAADLACDITEGGMAMLDDDRKAEISQREARKKERYRVCIMYHNPNGTVPGQSFATLGGTTDHPLTSYYCESQIETAPMRPANADATNDYNARTRAIVHEFAHDLGTQHHGRVGRLAPKTFGCCMLKRMWPYFWWVLGDADIMFGCNNAAHTQAHYKDMRKIVGRQ